MIDTWPVLRDGKIIVGGQVQLQVPGQTQLQIGKHAPVLQLIHARAIEKISDVMCRLMALQAVIKGQLTGTQQRMLPGVERTGVQGRAENGKGRKKTDNSCFHCQIVSWRTSNEQVFAQKVSTGRRKCSIQTADRHADDAHEFVFILGRIVDQSIQVLGGNGKTAQAWSLVIK